MSTINEIAVILCLELHRLAAMLARTFGDHGVWWAANSLPAEIALRPVREFSKSDFRLLPILSSNQNASRA
jgi:hypothetical protein